MSASGTAQVQSPAETAIDSAATARPSVAANTTPSIPDYELLRRIGGGAYGDVWLARSMATGALRAAKIVWRNTFEEERPFERYSIAKDLALLVMSMSTDNLISRKGNEVCSLLGRQN